MGDLISREEALKALKETYPTVWTESDYELGQKNQWSSDEIAILTAPSAEPGWIPVTERLPENLEVVNITYINREPATYYDHIKDKPMVATAVYYYKRFYWYSVACVDVLGEYGTDEWDEMDDRIKVTAWMPLPEGYRGGDAE